MAIKGLLWGVTISAGLWAVLIGGGLHIYRVSEGRGLRSALSPLDASQREQLNVVDGMMAGTAFSLDDYCGAQCHSGYGWSTCVDACVGK